MAATNIRLVDVATMRPALEVIQDESGREPVHRYVSKGRVASYFNVSELVQWGTQYGYQFVERDKIDRRWIEYLRLQRQVGAALAKITALEASLGLAGASVQASKVCAIDIAPEATVSTSGPLPSSGFAIEVTKNALRRATSALRKEKAARKRDAHLIQALKDCMTPTALDKLMRSTKVSRNHKPVATRKCRHVRFSDNDDELLGAKPLAGFDTVLTKDRLLKHAKPVRVQSTSGVYFLLDDADEVVYIGQAVNLVARIGTHCDEKRGLFSRVIAVEVPKHRLFELETKYIRAYRPRLNRSAGRRVTESN